MRVENTMKKPQNAWIRQIDNSFNGFVPLLETKSHFFDKKEGLIKKAGPGEGNLCREILLAQQNKREHPERYGRLVNFGEHKIQKD